MMEIQLVDSKKTMLNQNDIVIVAAHESDLSEVAESAKQHGMSPERLMYTIYASLLQNLALVLMRSGNTMFAIAAGEDRVGVVMVFNADTENNFVSNFNELLDASHKVGFNLLVINDVAEAIDQHMEEIEKTYKNASFFDDEDTGMPVIEFNNPHGG